SALGRNGKPLVGFTKVLRRSVAAGIQDGEVELAIGNAEFGGLREPANGGSIVWLARDAGGVQDGKVVHGAGIAGSGGLFVICDCLVEVAGNPVALLEEVPQAVLSRRRTTVCGKLVPVGGLGHVHGNAA